MTSNQRTAKKTTSVMIFILAVLTHFLIVAPIVYILIISFGYRYSFFAWHVICSSLAVGLLMNEAVFVISGDAYVSSRVSKRNRVTIHWILHTLGLILLIIGLIVIIVNKNRSNKSHFVSTHSKLGLSAIVLTSLATVSGILAKYTKWLYPRVKPVVLKIVHSLFGICIMIILLATLINGTYTHWWPSSNHIGRKLVFASFVIAAIFTFVKPILTTINRSKMIFFRLSSNMSDLP